MFRARFCERLISANPGLILSFQNCDYPPRDCCDHHFVALYLDLRVNTQQHFTSSSYMFLDTRTLPQIQLNPGLNLIIYLLYKSPVKDQTFSFAKGTTYQVTIAMVIIKFVENNIGMGTTFSRIQLIVSFMIHQYVNFRLFSLIFMLQIKSVIIQVKPVFKLQFDSVHAFALFPSPNLMI